MSYSRSLGDPNQRSSQLAFTGRYEKAFKVFSLHNDRLKIYLGYSLNPGYYYQRDVFSTSGNDRIVQFRRLSTLNLAVVPRLTYRISDRLSLDINTPISLNRWLYTGPAGFQNMKPGLEWQLTPQMQTRIGLSYRF